MRFCFFYRLRRCDYFSAQAGAVCDKVEGADPPALAKRIQEFANERVPEKGADGGADGAAGLPSDLRSKLKSLIR